MLSFGVTDGKRCGRPRWKGFNKKTNKEVRGAMNLQKDGEHPGKNVQDGRSPLGDGRENAARTRTEKRRGC